MADMSRIQQMRKKRVQATVGSENQLAIDSVTDLEILAAQVNFWLLT